ncbi:sigma-54-dependent Fis family transcriptional regulator [candidate division KSB1 bacterium]|nr:sigma-54-dependent Fis family transcriptional regulator [candidate division KSB1 bacterium]RQW11807.1 MAG: sigma-54-dependent Fis family transcriptional regulator [candidate division KSB1 bacterium]
MQRYTILVADDEATQREALAGFLQKNGYEVKTAASGLQALSIIQQNAIDLLLTDMRMPEMDGAALLTETKKLNPEIDVIVMTAFGSIETAIAAIKNGAIDFITKPVDLEQLTIAIKKALERKQLASDNRRLRELVNERLSFKGIIAGEAMSRALSIAARVAPSTATTLITGESGTGKELIAKAIHLASPRADRAFVAVNMAALSENLVESELFGHEKGAYTGATQQRQGRFVLADGGTLFIDEVGDIPLTMQVKLLRVLQEHQIERIGSASPIEVDVRVIAATNRSLEEMVAAATFRQDLYYRLNVVKIDIPPLRERKGDIPLLVDFFIRTYAEANGKRISGVTREAMDRLMKHPYPGNVRELENIIEQAVVLARGTVIGVDDLPMTLQYQARGAEEDESSGTFAQRVQAFEKALIREALQRADGVQTKAAAALGMSERHLRYKLQKYGLKERSLG